jgi:hypothetical protein
MTLNQRVPRPACPFTAFGETANIAKRELAVIAKNIIISFQAAQHP